MNGEALIEKLFDDHKDKIIEMARGHAECMVYEFAGYVSAEPQFAKMDLADFQDLAKRFIESNK